MKLIDVPRTKVRGIFPKAILLVLLTVLPQLALLWFVWQISKSEQPLFTRLNTELVCSIRGNQITSALFLAGLHHFHYVTFERKIDRDSSLKYRQILQDASDAFKAIPQNASLTIRMWSEVGDHAEAEANEIFAIQPGSVTTDAMGLRQRLRRMHTVVVKSFERYQSYQKAMARQFAEISQIIVSERKSKQTVSYLLLCGVIANACLGFVLVHFFNRDILSRVRILLLNAAKLPKKEKLSEKMSGDDEFAQVDDVFHSVSMELAAAHNFKTNLLAMVAHDMCSPLASVNLSLSIVENTEAERLNEECRKSLSTAIDEIDSLVMLAKEMLSIERLTVASASAEGEIVNVSNSEHLRQLSSSMKVELEDPAAMSLEVGSRFKPGIKKLILSVFLTPLIVAAVTLLLLVEVNFRQLDGLDDVLSQVQIASEVSQLIAVSAASTSYLTNFSLYGREGDRAMLLQFLDHEEAVYEKLRQLRVPRSTGAFASALERVRASMDKKKRLIAGTKPGTMNAGDAPGLPMFIAGSRLTKVSLQEEAAFLDVASSQLDALAAVKRQNEDLIKRADWLLICGMFANFTTALLAVTVFVVSIRRRLQVLSENAARLPQRKPLLPDMKGSDEIWYLDSVLRRAAVMLERSFEQSKLLMDTVSDDLKTPLKKVLVSLKPLEPEVSDFSQLAQKHFKLVKFNVERVIGLIDQLLTIENLDSGCIELAPCQFAVSEAVASSLNSVSSLAESRGVLLSQEPVEVSIEADMQRVIQVLVNFLTNAINHSPKGGTVSVVVTREEPIVRIAVEDCGPGLPEEMRSRVFERFFQAPNSATKKTGYGLGLAICKIIAEQHGGCVGVVEASTGGCSFFIELPL